MEAIYHLLASVLISAVSASYYPGVYRPSFSPWRPLCNGKMRQASGRTTLQGCTPSRSYGAVTSPARVERIKVKLFITSDEKPALTISFDAKSPDSPQVYKVTVLSDEETRPIYCGHVSTPKPGSEEVSHKFSLDMTCPSRKLTVGEKLKITVTPDGGYHYRSDYRLPGCMHDTMIMADECEEIREAKIKFKLKQAGNSTWVILDVKSAYRNKKDTEINVQLRRRAEGESLNGWQALGDPVQLRYPTRRFKFSGLTPKEHYSVLVWRDYEIHRFFESIFIRPQIQKYRRTRRRKRRNNN